MNYSNLTLDGNQVTLTIKNYGSFTIDGDKYHSTDILNDNHNNIKNYIEDQVYNKGVSKINALKTLLHDENLAKLID